MSEPASIRYNNPGAMWGGNSITKKWGETSHITLNDGLGQGNQIAVFPSKIQGAAAQFDLWRSSPHYKNQRLEDAIRTWSGGNSWQQYVNFLTTRTPGLSNSTIISESFLRSPTAIAMMKAQAWHEAGKPYPMSDSEWQTAQAMVFTGVMPKKKKTGAVVATTVVTGTSVIVQKNGGGDMMKEFWIVAPLFFVLGYMVCQFHVQLWDKISSLIWKK